MFEDRDGFRFLGTLTLGFSGSMMMTPFGVSLDSADDCNSDKNVMHAQIQFKHITVKSGY